MFVAVEDFKQALNTIQALQSLELGAPNVGYAYYPNVYSKLFSF